MCLRDLCLLREQQTLQRWPFLQLQEAESGSFVWHGFVCRLCVFLVGNAPSLSKEAWLSKCLSLRLPNENTPNGILLSFMILGSPGNMHKVESHRGSFLVSLSTLRCWPFPTSCYSALGEVDALGAQSLLQFPQSLPALFNTFRGRETRGKKTTDNKHLSYAQLHAPRVTQRQVQDNLPGSFLELNVAGVRDQRCNLESYSRHICHWSWC